MCMWKLKVSDIKQAVCKMIFGNTVIIKYDYEYTTVMDILLSYINRNNK